MSEYDDTNRGALFKNDRKVKDTHPDYKGTLNVGGVEYWVSSWIKTSQKGSKFMSLSVTTKDAHREAPAPAPQPEPPPKPAPAAANGGGFEDMDDDIPFINPMRGAARCLAM